MNASLHLVIGPMFAGKTTELVRRLVTFKKANLRVLYINSDLDSRGSDLFSTHNTSLSRSQEIEMVKTSKLMNIYESHCKSVDVIAIDEAQFFEDLVEFYMNFVEVDKKCLIVAGLNGTSDRESFGDITRLIPYCDNVEFIKPFCVRCSESKKITPAIFSKRLCGGANAICIGGGESYIPVCREHF